MKAFFKHSGSALGTLKHVPNGLMKDMSLQGC